MIIILAIIFLFSLVLNQETITKDARTFQLGNDVFLKDDKPFRIFSGSIHYFRIVPEKWGLILDLAKQAGLNTISTYIPWGLHQPYDDVNFSFDGILDIEAFLDLAKQKNLNVLLRVGPFNDAELDFGGLPTWLISKEVQIRTADPAYLSFVSKWISIVSKKMENYLYPNGGPIIMIQMENEYGFIGCDENYLNELYKIFSTAFPGMVLFTNDACDETKLRCGNGNHTLPLFATLDFGASSNITACANLLDTYQPNLPKMNSEFYTGWFSTYGYAFSRLDSGIFIKSLDILLSYNMSVNFYMFMGGTNFGFMSGTVGSRMKLITSYDYDAPLSEAGLPTEKYQMIRKRLAPLSGGGMTVINPHTPTSYGAWNVTFVFPLNILLDTLISDEHLIKEPSTPLEKLYYNNGFTLYKAKLPSFDTPTQFIVDKTLDEAVLILDWNYIERTDIRGYLNVTLEKQFSDSIVYLLQLNYGHIALCKSLEYKYLGTVTFGGVDLNGWIIEKISIENIDEVYKYLYKKGANNLRRQQNEIITNKGPTYSLVSFYIPSEVSDTFLYLGPCFQTGYVLVNGINIGYYNNVLPPQSSLYVPFSFLKTGMNEIFIFEFYFLTNSVHPKTCYIEFKDRPLFED